MHDIVPRRRFVCGQKTHGENHQPCFNNVDVIAEPQPNVCRTDDEVFMECMGCPPTCKNPTPQMCDLACFPGCVCKEGLVRRQSDNKCVPEDMCRSGKCEVHQSTLGVVAVAEASCSALQCPLFCILLHGEIWALF